MDPKRNVKHRLQVCTTKLSAVCGQVDYLALGMVVGTSIGLVVLASLCCASCVWCMKHDSAYGGSSRLVSAYSIR